MAACTFEINDSVKPGEQDILHPLGFAYGLAMTLRLYKYVARIEVCLLPRVREAFG